MSETTYAEYGWDGGHYIKDGHTMFPADVVKDLNWKSHLEQQIADLKREVDRMKACGNCNSYAMNNGECIDRPDKDVCDCWTMKTGEPIGDA